MEKVGGSSSASGSGSDGQMFPILSPTEALENLRTFGGTKRQLYLAMYSSVYGGIVTDPTIMSIPVDDHMCHRGHAVFDTACVENGYLYNANIHIARILNSARMAEIEHTFTAEWIHSVLVAVARAANDKNLALRYWITAGVGDFSYSPAGCIAPSFYCLAFQGFHMPSDPLGIKEVTISTAEVGMKQRPIATLKSTNYLANVLLHMAAKRKGGCYGIWVDTEGYLKEGPINSVIILDKDGVVRTPPAVDILSSCTAKRAMAIAAEYGYPTLMSEITLEDAYGAKELFFVGGDTHVISVTTLDERPVGDGKPGALWKLVYEGILREASEGLHDSIKVIE
jgi:4-amino-4-deoxychorismate lyase